MRGASSYYMKQENATICSHYMKQENAKLHKDKIELKCVWMHVMLMTTVNVDV